MRLLLELEPEEDFPAWSVGKHSIQAVIYSLLSGTEYEALHDSRTFKFFTFSDFFPGGDFRSGSKKRLLISSPDGGFIETLHEKFLPNERLYLGRHSLRLLSVKRFSLRPGRAFITGSPVVVGAPPEQGRFFTFKHHGSLAYFLERLTENALRKYEAFTGETVELNNPLFTRMVPRLRKKGWFDVYVRVNIRGRYFDVPGTNWEYLEIPRNGDRRLYSFLLDAGLGMLNSLGFGFVNPVKASGNHRKIYKP